LRARALFVGGDGSLRPVWRVLLFLLVAAVAAVVVGSAVATVLPPAASVLGFSPLEVLTLPVALLIAHWVMLAWVDGRPWSAVGLGPSHFRARLVGRGLALGALAIGLPCAALLSLRWLDAQPITSPRVTWLGFTLSVTWFLALAALWEELLMRGYIFAVLRERMGPAVALGSTSLVFGLLHLQNPGAGAQSLVIVTLAGLFLGGVLLATGSLYAAWMAHFAWNWVLVAVLHAPVSGASVPAPGYRVVDSGPDWATGGVWGPEGGVFAALGMVVGVAFLFTRRTRRGNT
jgi:membrane protease YdiL (CAAX protease family)